MHLNLPSCHSDPAFALDVGDQERQVASLVRHPGETQASNLGTKEGLSVESQKRRGRELVLRRDVKDWWSASKESQEI